MAERFDIAVVGGGMIGSSAARHLAERGHRIVVFAPPEPVDWGTANGPFASHYDAGRITRIADRRPLWAEMAARSIGRYGDIEARSGITFHDPRGLAWIGDDLDAPVRASNDRGGNARMVDPGWLLATTGIRAPNGADCAYEGGPAGVVNPRALVAAQLRLAELAGATIIPAAVDALQTRARDASLTSSAGQIEADRVLFATGPNIGTRFGIDLAVTRYLRTALLIDLGPAPEIPSAILGTVEHADVHDAYWVPPVRYPDGRVLFKIGCDMANARLAESDTDLTSWFQGTGDPAEAEALRSVAESLLPSAEFRSWDTLPCVVTRTETRNPYVGWIDETCAVAVGGNGGAAKSCDEIGRLAASLFDESSWSDLDLAESMFQPRFVAG